MHPHAMRSCPHLYLYPSYWLFVLVQLDIHALCTILSHVAGTCQGPRAHHGRLNVRHPHARHGPTHASFYHFPTFLFLFFSYLPFVPYLSIVSSSILPHRLYFLQKTHLSHDVASFPFAVGEAGPAAASLESALFGAAHDAA